MPSLRRRVTVGAAILAAISAARGTGWAGPTQTLSVYVRNDARLSDQHLESALAIAGSIYRRAGVAIEWHRATEGTNATSLITIVITQAAAGVGFRIADNSMGVARGVDRVEGVAYVFADRARIFAERVGADVRLILGCAVAHELGHLLLPANSHARGGIMQARWDLRLVSGATGVPGFAPDQARLLRLRLASRERRCQTRRSLPGTRNISCVRRMKLCWATSWHDAAAHR